MAWFSNINKPVKPAAKWIRTCQECGYKQETREAAKPPTQAYLKAKCKRCRSESLDFGSFTSEDDGEDFG